MALSAEQVGAIDALIEKPRILRASSRQFGSPLSKFQAIQHMLADMTIQAELARSLTHAAARAP
ncbi:MAG: acyl-CoA dehydrogenase family protein [Parvularculaceae bacterium]